MQEPRGWPTTPLPKRGGGAQAASREWEWGMEAPSSAWLAHKAWGWWPLLVQGGQALET